MDARLPLLILGLQVFSLPCFGQDATAANPPPADEKQLEVNWIYGAYIPKGVPRVPLDGSQRWDLYTKQTFTSPGIYAKTVLFSLGDQVSHSPREWDRDFEGFAQRLASRHGQFVIQSSLSAAGNAALGYEPRYDRCSCDGLWPRVSHAAVRNFVTFGSGTGRRPQLAMYGAAFGSGAISSMWKPKHEVWAESYRSAITQAGFGVLSNLLSEFAPEIIRIVR
jgi:hypothetical protein